MKRGFCLIIFFIIILPLVNAVTGEAITGRVPNVPTDVSVFVLPGVPSITIISPEDQIYEDLSILFNYSIGNGINSSWYNLDNTVNISLGNLTENSFYLDTTFGSHTLYLYANNSYGTNKANVSFIVEEESEQPPGGDDGPGTPGGDSDENRRFTVEPELIEASILQGGNTIEVLDITNTGNVAFEIIIELGNLSEFLEISEEFFSLDVGESKEIILKIFSRENEFPNSHVGNLIIKSSTFQKTINLIIDIRERQPLFDLLVKILSRKINPGDTIKANFEMLNLGDLTKIDVLLYYSIKDFEGNILAFKEESIAIETKLDIVRKIELPFDIDYGPYVLYSNISYKNISASSTEAFEVIEKTTIPGWILIIVVILIIAFILVIKRKFKNTKKSKKRKKKSKK